MQHNNNYSNKIITTLPKKWIRDHKQQKDDMTTQFDMTVKPISRIGVIPPNTSLWAPVLYLIHQEKNIYGICKNGFDIMGSYYLI